MNVDAAPRSIPTVQLAELTAAVRSRFAAVMSVERSWLPAVALTCAPDVVTSGGWRHTWAVTAGASDLPRGPVPVGWVRLECDTATGVGEPTRAVVTLWVHPGHRRRGVALATVDAAADAAAARDVAFLEVAICAENTGAVAAFHAAGFTDVPGDGWDGWVQLHRESRPCSR